MLSIQAVRGLPRLRAPGIVPCIISFSRQLPGSGQQETAATWPNAHLSLCSVLLARSADESVAAAVAPAVGQHCAGNAPTVLATADAQLCVPLHADVTKQTISNQTRLFTVTSEQIRFYF